MVVRLYARLDNPDGKLIPGVFARIELQLESEQSVLLVHEAAVMAQLNTRYVYTVGEGGVTHFTPVQLGDRVGDLRVVQAGLTGEEQIAITNLKKIFFLVCPYSPFPAIWRPQLRWRHLQVRQQQQKKRQHLRHQTTAQ